VAEHAHPNPDHDLVLEPVDGTSDSAAGGDAVRIDRAREVWSRMGGKLGVGFCLFGLLLVFLGWNGAASTDRVQTQMPYVISGGFAGLALVVIGVGLLIVQSNRADRAALQSSLRDLQGAIEAAATAGAGSAPAVAAARSALADGELHRPARQRPTPEPYQAAPAAVTQTDPEPEPEPEPEPALASARSTAGSPEPEPKPKPKAKAKAKAAGTRRRQIKAAGAG
jgi:outer membrane biosynthesis protein TonB